jgi:hypothetical protein
MLFMISANSAFALVGAWQTPTRTPVMQYKIPIVTSTINHAICDARASAEKEAQVLIGAQPQHFCGYANSAHHRQVRHEGDEDHERLAPFLASMGALRLACVWTKVLFAARSGSYKSNGQQHRLSEQTHCKAPVGSTLASGSVEAESRDVLIHPQQRLVRNHQSNSRDCYTA